MTSREKELLHLLHKEVKPALGCTEPIAVALATAKAVELVSERVSLDRMTSQMKLHVYVSGNILKNGMGVGIPGTGMIGLRIAAALGAVCGRSEYGLEVLKDLNDNAIKRAKELVAEGNVGIDREGNCHKLYVKCVVEAEGHSAWCVIEDEHDRIVETGIDGEGEKRSQSEDTGGCEERETRDYHLTVKEIYEFAGSVDYEDIKFILEDRTLNLALAQEGLKGDYGLKVGKTIQANADTVFGNDFLSYAMALTAAASDARMAGCTLPAMSNSGSGNQGITVSMPIIAYALKYDIPDEKLARALILSNLVAIHIKGYLGRLSALCGCVVASTGSSCGLVWLKGGSYEM
ncbi:MAG: L-serine ammonia-lyase, iron-sulfur-dependent, subunit alpha, partial [Bacteroidales bacterium]|nr:L-serine ammonia-lyase, iron-sulfur-dependent, subunit alpha [Bacteroidales bacterium]